MNGKAVSFGPAFLFLKIYILVYNATMKPQFNKSWLWIAIIIIGNITIFYFASKKLETFMVGSVEKSNMERDL